MKGRILVVDDDRAMTDLLRKELSREGFEVSTANAATAALEQLGREPADAVVTDVRMAGMDGLELCSRIVANHPDVPVIVATAFGNLETAVAAIRAGAYDFVTKPFDVDVLILALGRALQHRALRDEVRRLRRAVSESRRFDEMLGGSPAMQRVYDLLDRYAASDATALVTGESGTGKELAALALHRRSRRAKAPFVAVNCSAVPEPLLESELFGHVRGAFTDAKTARSGLFQKAAGGTLFLDEIGELPLGLQPKLLRVLQARTVRPVGGDEEIAVDVRVVAATNRDIEAAVEEGRFREDLYYRLAVLSLEMPPLRARGGDVLLLAQHFVERFATQAAKNVTGLSPEAASKLAAYHWPGNVRELQNSIERAVALATYDRIVAGDLPDRIVAYEPAHVLITSRDPSELVPLEEMERRYVAGALEACGGNKSSAARILGIDRKTLQRKLGKPADE